MTGKGFIRTERIGSLLYFLAAFICAYLQVYAVGFTKLTEEGQSLMLQYSGEMRTVVRILFWALTLGEAFRDRRRLLAGIPFCILYSVQGLPGQNMFLVEIALLSLLGNYSTGKRIILFWLGMHSAYLIVLVLLFRKGLAMDSLMPNFKSFIPVNYGHSYGMGHPNTLAVYILTTALGGWTVFRPDRTWKTALLFEGLALLTFWLTLSRTTACLMAAFPLIYLLSRKVCSLPDRKRKTVRTAALLSPLFFIGCTFALSLAAASGIKGIVDHTGNFWMRFQDAEAVKTYGLTLWGTLDIDFSRYVLDNVYYRILLCCGVVPFILTAVLCSLMQIRIISEKRVELLSVSLLLLAFGLMERAGMYSFFNFLPMAVFASGRITDLLPQAGARGQGTEK